MAYLNTAWLSEDEHAEFIAANETITAYNTKIDREIERICLIKGVRVDEIPVDGSGYLTSRVLQSYAIEYALYSLFRGYWGNRGGTNNIYYEKMLLAKEEVQRLKDDITYENILGLTDDNGDPKCSNSYASQVAV